jgi:molecular chaperone GrpE
MSKKERAKTEISDSEVQEKESADRETQADVEQPSGEATEDTQVADKTQPEEELCEEERLKQQIEELEDKHLRLAAEFDNYKKRMTRQYEEIMRFANDRILLELLEVVDNFERALHHGNDNTDFETFRKGTELIFSQITTLLGKHDISPIEALGKPFDPNLHEAVMPVESEDYPEGVVAVEMSKGYMKGDRVLRHSKVGVSKGKPKNKEEGRK